MVPGCIALREGHALDARSSCPESIKIDAVEATRRLATTGEVSPNDNKLAFFRCTDQGHSVA